MNERIKELAEQAGFYVAMFDPRNKDNEAIEKFAELIVRECMDIVDNEGCGEGGSIRAMEQIKQHFGIKE